MSRRPQNRTFSRTPATAAAAARAACEALESRTLLSGPSAREQQMLELINRLRTSPKAELPLLLASKDPDIQNALAFFKTDKALLARQWAELTPVPPLAWNANLTSSAFGHTKQMLAKNQQSHQLPGEAPLLGRVTAAGYQNASFIGENVFAFMESIEHAHAGFAIDWGNGPGGIQKPAGHRENLMAGAFSEVGISVVDSTSGKTVGPYLVTQNFGARRGQQASLLGVVYDDKDKDKSYDPGEGVDGATVIASGKAGVFTIESMTAGGYQMQLPPGTYTVTVSGGGLKGIATATNVVVGSNNVKRDFARSAFQPDAAGPTAALAGAAPAVGGAWQGTFSVNWSDAAGLNTKTLSSGDLLVTGPGGFAQAAQLVSVDNQATGTARRATYRFNAPGGFFDSAENGVYTVSVRADQVADVNGNFAATRSIGTFEVDVPPVVMTPGGVLVANGTAGDDRIDFALSGTSLVVKVNQGAYTFKRDTVRRIYVAAMAGDDFVTFHKNVIGVTLDGGAGNDTLGGTASSDTISGGDGDDRILGRWGDDVLNSGEGADTVNGGDGNDTVERKPGDVLARVEVATMRPVRTARR